MRGCVDGRAPEALERERFEGCEQLSDLEKTTKAPIYLEKTLSGRVGHFCSLQVRRCTSECGLEELT
jgi:hypothetical protein